MHSFAAFGMGVGRSSCMPLMSAYPSGLNVRSWRNPDPRRGYHQLQLSTPISLLLLAANVHFVAGDTTG